MGINRAVFYNTIKPLLFHGHLNQKQVLGMESDLNFWEQCHLNDIRHLAYMMATEYHETAHTMQPIEEWGKGRGHSYGQKIKRSGAIYTSPNEIYYGRGKVQLTWFENYQLMGRLLGIDLLHKPELALDMDIATSIMFEGMLRGSSSFGDFTGKCLEMYFNNMIEDPLHARKIINGMDKAEEIEGYYWLFKKGLILATA